MKITKKQVLEWLEDQHDKYAGRAIDAEEADKDEKMLKAMEVTNKIEIVIDIIENL